MVRDVIGIAIIVLVYACLIVIVFSPTIYAVWFCVVGRKMALKNKQRLLRTALMTFCINLILAYFLVHFGFDYVVTSRISEMDDAVGQSVRNAVVSEEKFFARHGRYYPVGPVRGPYKDDHGLVVGKDVVLEVVPVWDKDRGAETFKAYAVHIWGRNLISTTKNGKVEKAAPDSEETARLRAKLLRSVR
jgi:hypothetical protein